MSRAMGPSVAIVGGGATGVIAALHLLRETSADITLFEPSGELGAGLAFGTNDPVHLLNVPAAQMSCAEDDPRDFLHWLEENAPYAFQADHFPFVPRALYRKYLQARLREAEKESGARFRWVRALVESVERNDDLWELSVAGEKISFSYCLLATGYRKPSPPPLLTRETKSVVIYGMGLTAIDLFRQLRAQGFTGIIHFVSRRGFFPLPHLEGTNAQPGPQNLAGRSPLEAFRIFRVWQRAGHIPWQRLADEGRAQASAIWQAWNERQRAQFLRHLKPYWERARHRAPGSVLSEIFDDLQAGTVVVHRGSWTKTKVNAHQIYFALGNEIEPPPMAAPPGARQNLFTLGPAGKDRLWEITAIPEIRRQAKEMARFLALAHPPRAQVGDESKNLRP